MDEKELAALAQRVFEVLPRDGTWLTFGKLASRLLRGEDSPFRAEAACLTRRDLFAIQVGKRVKLKHPDLCRPGFDPFAPPLEEAAAPPHR